MSAARASISIVDKPLPSGKGEVSASAFAFLFSELVQYSLHRVKRTADLETRLESAGHSIGLRVLELLVHREKANRKETNLIAMLQFVTTTVWRALFGKVADGLEKSNNSEDEYYISDKEPVTNRFISVPKEMGQLNCAAFIGGIVRGVLDSAEFKCTVVTHLIPDPEKAQRVRTVYAVKFAEEVVVRDKRLS